MQWKLPGVQFASHARQWRRPSYWREKIQPTLKRWRLVDTIVLAIWAWVVYQIVKLCGW